MFQSRFFWRLYLTYTTLVLATAGVIGLLVQEQMVRSLGDQIEARLLGEATALLPFTTPALRTGETARLRPGLLQVAATTRTRITLVTPAGLVLADTARDASDMENHAGRPEIIQSLATGTGVARRLSSTLGIPQLYVALAPLQDGIRVGVTRVSIPLAEVEAELAAVRTQIYRGGAVGTLLALVLGWLVAGHMTAPIVQMTRVSEALRRGEHDRRAEVRGSDEIRTLADNLNRLADELTGRISKLAHQGEQLEAIISGMQEGVVALDERGDIVLSNEAARRLLGIDHAAVENRPEALPENPPLDELIAEVRSTLAPARREVTLGPETRETVLDARVTPLTTGGHAGLLLVLYDVTSLRRLERVRTDFVANVSHELKTPLTSIHGYIETLLDGAVHDPDNNIRFLSKIEHHVRRLSALVSDLLSLARIETPDRAVAAPPTDWREVVRDSLTRHREPIEAKHLDVELDLGIRPVCVAADPEALRQIIDNLLDNAISYTSEGGRVCIRVQANDEVGALAVADTGIGIPTDALDRIFERFYRVDRGRSRALGGTGLGLSIVRNVVERAHGSISVDSEVGRGSTFKVEIPRAVQS